MTQTGWIGSGAMGGPAAGHLLEAEHELHAFNRTRERTDDCSKPPGSGQHTNAGRWPAKSDPGQD